MNHDLRRTRPAALSQPRRTLDDAAPLARLLAFAFHDDPVSEWVRPGGATFVSTTSRSERCG